MERHTVELPDGRCFSFKDADRADRFAAREGGKRVPFDPNNDRHLAPELRERLAALGVL